MIIDLSPLKRYPQFRLLYFGQLVSLLGSSISYIGAPYLIYELTNSSAQVGLLGIVSLIPLVVFGFLGGAVADVWNRKKIIIVCEILLAISCAALAYLVQTDQISETGVMLFTGWMSALAGFHRPALESLTPRLVLKEDISKVSALIGFRGTFAHILGPAIGGLLIATGGAAFAFWADSLSYLISLIAIIGIKNPARDASASTRPTLGQIWEGLQYAMARPLLIGTYILDMIAMVFCFPMALFPAIAATTGGETRLGPLYAAISVGAMLATLFSRWTYKVRRHGLMVVLGALGWCVGILSFGVFVEINFWVGFLFLAFAGYWDMISSTFRFTIWNETIPDSHRGRLANFEMLSSMSGPLLGNTLLGYLAHVTTAPDALVYGSTLSIIFTIGATLCLLPFWNYMAEKRHEFR